MTWTNRPYCSVDDVKSIADRRSTTDDDLIASLIPQAQANVDAELGFSFQTDGTLAAPADRIYDGPGGQQLLIRPCLSFSRVLVRTYLVVQAPDGTLSRTASDVDITLDVLLYPANVLPGFVLERYTGDDFDFGRQNIVVSGIWGYDTVPGGIARACARLTAHYLAQRDARYQDQTGSDQTGRLVFRQQIPADVKDLIRRARPAVIRG